MRKRDFTTAKLIGLAFLLALRLAAADIASVRGTIRARNSWQGNAEASPGSIVHHPVLGYITERGTAELRAILGVPGAATLSVPLVVDASAVRIRLAPGQGYALLERREDDPALIRLDGIETGAAVPMPGALRAPDVVAFSGSGQAVVLYSSTDGRLQVWKGLPAVPRRVREISGLREPIETAALSDDAGSVLLAARGAVYRLSDEGGLDIALSTAGGAALAFLPNSTTGVIADRQEGSIYLYTGQLEILAAVKGGIGELRAGAGGSRVWATSADGQQVHRVNVRTRQHETFDLQVAARSLDEMVTPGLYLISSEPGEPAWMLVEHDDTASAVFVPARVRGLTDGRRSKGVSNR